MGTFSPEDGAGDLVSFARDELQELLMIARWCAKLLAEPPPAGYSDEDQARIHEILERNLSQLQSRVNALRNKGAGETKLG